MYFVYSCTVLRANIQNRKTSVFSYGPASRMYFSARSEGRISYGHLGRTNSCLHYIVVSTETTQPRDPFPGTHMIQVTAPVTCFGFVWLVAVTCPWPIVMSFTVSLFYSFIYLHFIVVSTETTQPRDPFIPRCMIRVTAPVTCFGFVWLAEVSPARDQ